MVRSLFRLALLLLAIPPLLSSPSASPDIPSTEVISTEISPTDTAQDVHKPPPPYTIFVSIPSFLDGELPYTITTLLSTAIRPETLHITILNIESPTTAAYRLQKKIPPPFHNYTNVNVLSLTAAEAKTRNLIGAGAARAYIQEFYDNETYYLQLDSHHRFVPGWDITLIKKLSQCSKMAAGPPTSVLITQYLNEYKPTWDEKQFKTAFNDRPHRLAAKFFDIAPRHITNATDLDEYYPMKVRYSPVKTPLHGTHTLAQTAPPQPTAFLSGHFIFSYGSFVTDVPYDPNIPFDGEEDSMAIRAFTSGYDMFTIIDRVFMLHFYNRKDFKTAWGEFGREWDKWNAGGLTRLRELLTSADGHHAQDVDKKYGLGTTRSLSAYEEFSGVYYGRRVLARKARTGDATGGRGGGGGQEEFLWVGSEEKTNRDYTFQKQVGAWWHMNNSTMQQQLQQQQQQVAGVDLLEVVSPDWEGVGRVILYDPKSGEKQCQIRLTAKAAEERCVTPLGGLKDKNSTTNGHNGWTRWRTLAKGAWY